MEELLLGNQELIFAAVSGILGSFILNVLKNLNLFTDIQSEVTRKIVLTILGISFPVIMQFLLGIASELDKFALDWRSGVVAVAAGYTIHKLSK